MVLHGSARGDHLVDNLFDRRRRASVERNGQLDVGFGDVGGPEVRDLGDHRLVRSEPTAGALDEHVQHGQVIPEAGIGLPLRVQQLISAAHLEGRSRHADRPAAAGSRVPAVEQYTSLGQTSGVTQYRHRVARFVRVSVHGDRAAVVSVSVVGHCVGSGWTRAHGVAGGQQDRRRNQDGEQSMIHGNLHRRASLTTPFHHTS